MACLHHLISLVACRIQMSTIFSSQTLPIYRSIRIFAVVLGLIGLVVPLSGCSAAPATLPIVVEPTVNQVYTDLPLGFEANHGQVDSRVSFLGRGHGYTVFLAESEVVLALRGSDLETEPPAGAVRMRFPGSNPAPAISGLDPLITRSHRFSGSDPHKWVTDIPNFAGVKYSGIYPNIDLVFYGHRAELRFDFIVAPGGVPDVINLSFVGTKGLRVNAQEELVLLTDGGELRMPRPFIYQEKDGLKEPISGGFRPLGESSIGFWVAAYDSQRPLVIDPAVTYATYLGGTGIDTADGIVVDSDGNVYITGDTASTDFPVAGQSPDSRGGATDVFVAKINPSGDLAYVAYLGGSQAETGKGIAVDPSGNVYITGETSSSDFPTAQALQATLGGETDGFVVRLSTDGSFLIYSTYLGGSDEDHGEGITVDGSGNAYVTGETESINFPTANPLQSTIAGASDAFVAKLNPPGTTLAFATYLGGSGEDNGEGIALDESGDIFIAGTTGSGDFPTVQPFQETLGGGTDAFVARLNSSGTVLEYATYLGGGGDDESDSLDVDASGNVYLVGETASSDFPTAEPLQSFRRGVTDAFVAKLNVVGEALVYATYLGGAGSESGSGIVVDAFNRAYIVGRTTSVDFPVSNSIQGYGGGDADAFVAVLEPSGTEFIYATFLGGSGHDSGEGIALGQSAAVYVTGLTVSENFPTFDAIQGQLQIAEPIQDESQTDDSPAVRSILPDAFVVRLVTDKLGATPESIAFQDTPVREATAATVTISNQGLTVAQVLEFNLNSPHWRVTPGTCDMAALNPGASCQVELTFVPQQAGSHTGVFRVESNVADASVLLEGRAVAPGRLQASPDPLFFADTTLGEEATVNLTLTNTGTGPATISGFGLSSSSISLTNNACSGASLMLGEECSLTVEFRPEVPGQLQVELEVTSDDAGDLAIPIMGLGVLSNPILQRPIDGESIGGLGLFGLVNPNPVPVNFRIEILRDGELLATFNQRVSTEGWSSGAYNPEAVAEFQVPASEALSDGQYAWRAYAIHPQSGQESAPSPEATFRIALGRLEASPEAVSFEDTVVGEAAVSLVIFTNQGGAPVTVETAELTSPHWEVAQSTCTQTVLDPGASCQVDLAFKPQVAGSFSTTLRLISDVGESLVGLNGVGSSFILLEASPESITFEDTTVGETAVASVTFTNRGTAPVTVDKAELTSPHWQITQSTCTQAILDSGASCQVDLAFKPQVAGSLSTSLHLLSDVGESLVDLNGLGSSFGQLEASPKSITFEDTTVGETAFASVIFTNQGTAPVTVDKAELTSPHWQVTQSACTQAILETASSCLVDLAFVPQVAGSFSTNLRLISDVGESLVELNGVGISFGRLEASPESVSFGVTLLGDESSANVTITNVGDGPASISDFGLNTPSVLVVEANCAGKRLEPGEECFLTVAYRPDRQGQLQAELGVGLVEGEDLVVPLNGRALRPSPDLVVTEVLGPDSALAGETVTITWTVENRGTAPVAGAWLDTVGVVQDLGYEEEAPISEDADATVLAEGTLNSVFETVTQTAILEVGQRETFSAEIRVSGTLPGPHRWHVETNTPMRLLESDEGLTNNSAISAGIVRLRVPEISLDGSPLIREITSTIQPHWFQVQPAVNRDTDVSVTLPVNSGLLRLLVGRGYLPTRGIFDQSETGANVMLRVPGGPESETHYFLVYPRGLNQVPVGFRIDASNPRMNLESVSPSKVGNSGPVSLELHGGGFLQDVSFEISGPGGSRSMTRFTADSGSVGHATFDLTGLAPGSYDVTMDGPSGNIATLSGHLTLESDHGVDIELSLKAPGIFRAGRQLPIVLTYRNNSNADVALPFITIAASHGELRIRRNSVVSHKEMTLLAPTVIDGFAFIPPGSLGKVTLYYTPPRADIEVTFEVWADTVSLPEFAGLPLNWDSIGPNLRRAGGSDEAWTSFVAGERRRYGETYEDLFAFLTTQMADLAAKDLKNAVFVEGQWFFGSRPTSGPLILRGGVSSSNSNQLNASGTTPPLNSAMQVYAGDTSSTDWLSVSFTKVRPAQAFQDAGLALLETPARYPEAVRAAPAVAEADGVQNVNVLIIMNEDYAQQNAHDLPAAKADFNTVDSLFRKTFNYPNTNVRSVLDDSSKKTDDLTPLKVSTEIKQAGRKLDADDLLIVWVGAHGACPFSRTADGFQAEPSGTLFNGGLMTPDEYSAAFNATQSRVLFILDTCFAASVTAEITNPNVTTIAATDWNQKAIDGLFTPKLVDQLQNDPSMEILDAVPKLSRETYEEGINSTRRGRRNLKESMEYYDSKGKDRNVSWEAYKENGYKYDGLINQQELKALSDSRYQSSQVVIADPNGASSIKLDRPDAKKEATDDHKDREEIARFGTRGGSSVRASYDPNEKVVSTVLGAEGYLRPDGELGFTIFFENDPVRATLPAQVVRITDTLDDNLDLSTFAFTEIAAGELVINVPPGSDAFSTTVDIIAGGVPLLLGIDAQLDFASRTVEWTFTSLDPFTLELTEDPLAGFLLVNDATRRGEGHVGYSISPRSGLSSGARIANTASIVFDLNDPLVTNETLVTVDGDAPSSAVDPLPATTSVQSFTVTWSGTDQSTGSGVAFYDVYYSVNGGTFEPLLLRTDETSTMFEGEDGHSYAFYSQAHDLVGYVEARPLSPDAKTEIVAPVASDPDQVVSDPNHVDSDRQEDGGSTLSRSNWDCGGVAGGCRSCYFLDCAAQAGVVGRLEHRVMELTSQKVNVLPSEELLRPLPHLVLVTTRPAPEIGSLPATYTPRSREMCDHTRPAASRVGRILQGWGETLVTDGMIHYCGQQSRRGDSSRTCKCFIAY